VQAVDRVRVAIVGLGYWGPNLVRNLHELPEAEVVGICDLHDERLEHVGRLYPGVERTRDFTSLLEDPGVDAVVVATPVSTHFELAAAALEAGKHVLVEKPMAASSEEALALVALADAKGVLLMPGHTFVYSPSVNVVRDLIRSGDLGDVYFVSSSRVNLGIHQPDVSVIWDLGPHEFSILHHWLGESPESASATTRSCVIPGVADVAFVTLRYPSGIVANIELAWLSPSKLRRTTVAGSQKMVVYDDTSHEPVRVFDAGVEFLEPRDFEQYRLSYRTGNIVSPAVSTVEPLMLELADFCRSIVSGSEPRSSTSLGIDVIRTIELVERVAMSVGARSGATGEP
jgi:predicted dehydrogenase